MSKPEDTIMNSGGGQPDEHPADELPAELRSYEARLATLSPREDRLDRDRLMFLAGQASAERKSATLSVQNWKRHPAWPAGFAAMSAAAATLLGLLISQLPPIDAPATPAQNFAQSSAMPKGNQIGDDRPKLQRDMLTASDAHHSDIETVLVGRAIAGDEANPAPRDSKITIQPTLTPTAWKQVIEAPNDARLPVKDSSKLRTSRGITT